MTARIYLGETTQGADNSTYGQFYVDANQKIHFVDDVSNRGDQLVVGWENGTFTPYFADTSHSSGEGQTSGSGYYEVWGKLIICWITITKATFGTLTLGDQAYLDGLPYTVQSSCYGGSSMIATYSPTGTGHVVAVPVVGQTYCELHAWDSTGGTSAQTLNDLNSGGFQFVSRLAYIIA